MSKDGNGKSVPSRYKFDFYDNDKDGNIINTAKNKNKLFTQYMLYMLNRTIQMFKYEGLPDSIPKKDLEYILQLGGYATITEVDGKLYAFSGELGGMLNEYYLPTLSIVANPYLRFTKTLKIDEDCIVMLNDSLYIGLRPMFDKYSDLLATTDISMYWAIINTRMQRLYDANDDNTFKSVSEVFEHLEKGDKMCAVGSSPLMESLNSTELSSGTTTNLTSLIEMKQYLLASWYIDLGLSANYNMKRESLSENELNSDEDVMLPLIDDMLEQRKLACVRINEKYGTNITVELSSSWKKIRNDIKLSQESKDEEITDDIVKDEEIVDNIEEKEYNEEVEGEENETN